eukprot:746574-Hanusia_phi.AAC.2
MIGSSTSPVSLPASLSICIQNFTCHPSQTFITSAYSNFCVLPSLKRSLLGQSSEHQDEG